MKLINSNVEHLEFENSIVGIKKAIEIAGRTCYKSEGNITENSYEVFVQRLINNGHTAMLEHGIVYLTIPLQGNENKAAGVAVRHIMNKYSVVNYNGPTNTYYITTNYRVLVENDWLEDLEYLTEPCEHHKKCITFRITCDRGVSHEIVRHRTLSFAQESTRYCNYSKDKFDNEITYIIPTKLEDKLEPGQYVYWDGDWCDLNDFKIMYPCNNDTTDMFLQQLNSDELTYSYLTNTGWTAQEARQVLPNALKTEIVVTGFVEDIKHFIELRSAKNAHPDIQKIANQMRVIIEENK